jgi:hypothetical protein
VSVEKARLSSESARSIVETGRARLTTAKEDVVRLKVWRLDARTQSNKQTPEAPSLSLQSAHFIQADFKAEDREVQLRIEELKSKQASLREKQRSAESGLVGIVPSCMHTPLLRSFWHLHVQSALRSKMGTLQQQLKTVDRTAGSVETAESSHRLAVSICCEPLLSVT